MFRAGVFSTYGYGNIWQEPSFRRALAPLGITACGAGFLISSCALRGSSNSWPVLAVVGSLLLMLAAVLVIRLCCKAMYPGTPNADEALAAAAAAADPEARHRLQLQLHARLSAPQQAAWPGGAGALQQHHPPLHCLYLQADAATCAKLLQPANGAVATGADLSCGGGAGGIGGGFGYAGGVVLAPPPGAVVYGVPVGSFSDGCSSRGGTDCDSSSCCSRSESGSAAPGNDEDGSVPGHRTGGGPASADGPAGDPAGAGAAGCLTDAIAQQAAGLHLRIPVDTALQQGHGHAAAPLLPSAGASEPAMLVSYDHDEGDGGGSGDAQHAAAPVLSTAAACPTGLPTSPHSARDPGGGPSSSRSNDGLGTGTSSSRTSSGRPGTGTDGVMSSTSIGNISGTGGSRGSGRRSEDVLHHRHRHHHHRHRYPEETAQQQQQQQQQRRRRVAAPVLVVQPHTLLLGLRPADMVVPELPDGPPHEVLSSVGRNGSSSGPYHSRGELASAAAAAAGSAGAAGVGSLPGVGVPLAMATATPAGTSGAAGLEAVREQGPAISAASLGADGAGGAAAAAAVADARPGTAATARQHVPPVVSVVPPQRMSRGGPPPPSMRTVVRSAALFPSASMRGW